MALGWADEWWPRAAARGFPHKPYPHNPQAGGALGGVEVAQEFVKEKYSGVTLA